MKVIALGTNGWFPSYGRETMSYLIPLKKRLLILDGGTGLFRLFVGKLNQLVQKYEEVDFFFSHFHFDHIMGFFYLHKILRAKKVNIHGPAKSINQYSPEEVLKRFISHPFYSLTLDEFPFKFNFVQLKSGHYRMADYSVLVRRQDHPQSSLAYSFDFGLSYLTDSDCVEESVKLVQGAKILLHEHWRSGEKLFKKENVKISQASEIGHTTAFGAALIAEKAKVGKLFLVHHYPFYNKRQLNRNLQMAKKVFRKTELLFDLNEIGF